MKRILIKLSGEALKGISSTSFSQDVIENIGHQIHELLKKNVQVAVVIGGGNIFRGKENVSFLGRAQADQMGMLATVMNGLALKSAFAKKNVPVSLFSSFSIAGMVDIFSISRALEAMENKHVVICVGGTGSPYFTTDTAAVLRGIELKCEAILKATKVDGVYDADPHHNKNAIRFDRLSYQEVLEKGLQVMDSTAIALAAEHKIPLMVFSLLEKNCFERVLNNQLTHTVIE